MGKVTNFYILNRRDLYESGSILVDNWNKNVYHMLFSRIKHIWCTKARFLHLAHSKPWPNDGVSYDRHSVTSLDEWRIEWVARTVNGQLCVQVQKRRVKDIPGEKNTWRCDSMSHREVDMSGEDEWNVE